MCQYQFGVPLYCWLQRNSRIKFLNTCCEEVLLEQKCVQCGFGSLNEVIDNFWLDSEWRWRWRWRPSNSKWRWKWRWRLSSWGFEEGGLKSIYTGVFSSWIPLSLLPIPPQQFDPPPSHP